MRHLLDRVGFIQISDSIDDFITSLYAEDPEDE